MAKILILDDDELGNELVSYLLAAEGITDYEFQTSGEDALSYLEICRQENNFPAIMFVDINMPGMNGFDYVTRYEEKYRQSSPHTHVVMLTNSVLSSERQMALSYESISDFWNKPLSPVKLKKLMESLKI
jgi:CheY-like chemotaxis protein